LQEVKNELDQQLAAANLIDNGRTARPTRSPLPVNNKNNHVGGGGGDDDDEENEIDRNYEETLTVDSLLEDLTVSPDECAFPSINQNKCLTNRQVYRLINNRTDLMKVSRDIEQQLYKSNEQMCTSIDLSE
jgi:hypothetical protein